MLVELSSFIESDLEAIADYIAQDNPMRAVSFIREIREELRLVGQNPLLYQLRPEIGEDARLAVVGRYVILFRIDRGCRWHDRLRGVGPAKPNSSSRGSTYPLTAGRGCLDHSRKQSPSSVLCPASV